MTDVLATTGRTVLPLSNGWELAILPARACRDPGELDAADWIAAIVPGTAAGALRALGRWSFDDPQPLHDKDVWYRVRVTGHGRRTLRCEGLATIADVFLDGRLILSSTSMFEVHDVEVTLDGEHWLHIAFRSLQEIIATAKGSRPRWKTMMITEPRLRLLRTSLIGHMPGWCPPVDVVGPYRQILLIDEGPVRVGEVDLRTRLDDRAGVLSVCLDLHGVPAGAKPILRCAGGSIQLGQSGSGVTWQGALRIPDVAPWWPHTHGEPCLHTVAIDIGDVHVDLGKTGFRTIEIDRGADGNGFALRVNGVSVFCRGACWTPIDVVSLNASDTAYAAALGLLRSAGLNMVRLSGTLVYESPAFHRACDELGILVWQDAMLANFDYPTDEVFAGVIGREVAAVARRLGASPSLAVFCGGSEVGQQAAMMGLPKRMRDLPLADTVIPQALAGVCDVAYVSGSPSGGTLPFVPAAGPSHYYGVGAYLRPLEDARRAQVRFASECLAFANLPDEAMFAAHRLDPAENPARWLARVPRDLGATWDFDDVREHYLRALWGEDGRTLRHSDPRRWRDLSRAIAAEVIERTIDEWRRPGSVTAGALLWFWRDLWPAAGWGLVDSDGRPKSVFYALKRACAALRLIISDEGTNGLYLHLVNDAPRAVSGKLSLTCLRDGKTSVITAARDITVGPHGGHSVSAFDLFGVFFDAGYCYRFGPPSHDVVHATFVSDGGENRAEAFHFLNPPQQTARVFEAAPQQDQDGFYLELHAATTLRFISLSDDRFVPEDNYFHLAAGCTRKLRLVSKSETGCPDGPSLKLTAL